MSLRMLQKKAGAAPSEPSAEAKATLQPGGHSKQGGGYYASNDGGGKTGGSYYDSHASSGPGRGGGSSSSSAGYVASPGVPGGFRGSDAQKAHVEAMRRSTAENTPASMPTHDVAVRSNLGLNALRERKAKEEEEKHAKREAARAKRRSEATQQDVADEQTLAECEAQAWQDSESNERVKYEAALIVRIALRFGSSSVWTKLAEARARGAELPLDPRRIYLLAHPDKCPLPEAADATAILNAQRPPEMLEARPRVATKAAAKAVPKASAEAAHPQDAGTDEHEDREEVRVDPEDGQELTFQQLQEKYKQIYVAEDIQEYWSSECQPSKLKSPAKSPAAAPPEAEEPASISTQAQRKTRRF
ncbi:unnamed protein product [Effrenium voratum]|uniref:Uncharacterized protein n=1 Tax=Effrenium voratum TaxID=2562239 RepID=A0AA36MLE4_9DINO|nr:unnamed protein product [Effrenium voratum]